MLEATPPNLIGQPKVSFNKDGFDSLIFNFGYNIIIEKAVRCPCEGKDSISLSDCQNCFGTSYLYINPFKTLALIIGINRDTKFKEWSEELIGTISISVRDNDDPREKVAFYDRITLTQRKTDQVPIYGFYSEVTKIRDNGSGGKFIFLTYKLQEMIDMFFYTSSISSLTKVDSSKYTINSNNPYVLDLNLDIYPSNEVLSIRYKSDLQYHIIDIPHEIRYNTIKNKNGQLETITLPLNAIARRSHILQVERPDYSGSGLQNNTYIT